MSLFQTPHPATIDGKPVLWFGIDTIERSEEGSTWTTLVAIVVSPKGRVGTAPLNDVVADVRFVDDLSPFEALGRTGPGWVDLEDMVSEQPAAAPEAVKLDDVKRAIVDTITEEAPPAPPPSEGLDYITSPDGQKWDPLTNLPID